MFWIRIDLGPPEKRKKNRFETFVIPRQPGIVKSFKLLSRNVGTICLSWMKIVNQLHSPTPWTVLGFSSEKLWFLTSICSGGWSGGALFRSCLGMCVAAYLQNQYKNTREEGSMLKAFGEDFSGVSESLFCDGNFNDHGGSRELM